MAQPKHKTREGIENDQIDETPRVSSVTGQDLLDLFNRLGCPKDLVDGMKGDDLDWVWEMCKDDEAKDFLSWITDPQNASDEKNILTDEELEKWDRLQIEQPTAILSGQRLHDALEAIGQGEALVEEEIMQTSDEALRSMLSEKRELLDCQETKREELNRLCVNLNTRKSKLALKVSQAEQKNEELDRELVDKQQTLLHLNVEHNNAAETLGENILNIQDKVGKMKIGEEKIEQASIPRVFFSHFDKNILLMEDNLVSNKINQYLKSKFKQANDNESTENEQQFVSQERSQNEYEKTRAEITRLQYCYQDAERENIMRSAELVSGKVAKVELEKQKKKLIQGQVPMDKSSLQASISELETVVNNLEQELSNMMTDKLSAHLAEETSSYCQGIFRADLETKIARQELTLSEMDMAIEFLLEQASYQEVLGMLIEKEGNGLVELKQKLDEILSRQVHEIEQCEKANNHAKNVNDNKNRRSKKTLQPDDKFLITMHRVLTNTDVDPNMITEDDVLNLMSSFAEKINDLDKSVIQTEAAWKKKKLHIQGVIERVQNELQIDSNNGCVLTPAQVSNKIKLAENKVREFEVSVKKKIEEWEKLKREIKANPKDRCSSVESMFNESK